MKMRKSRTAAFLSGALLVGALAGQPLVAHAADYTYYHGELLIGAWKYSTTISKTGAKSYGINFVQFMRLQNSGFGMVTGLDYIFVSHARTVSRTQCSWWYSGLPSNTVAWQTCKYVN